MTRILARVRAKLQHHSPMVAEAVEGLLRDGETKKQDGIVSGVTRFGYEDLIGTFGRPPSSPGRLGLGSKLCQQEDFAYNEYRYWCEAIRETPAFHRKQWEFFFICQSLFERDMLRPGRRGLCFGAGLEPLPALFASMGCEIVATDQSAVDAERSGWTETDQHSAGVEALNQRGICRKEDFAARASFRVVDMNAVPDDLSGGFDFCWSACCFEHLGSLEHGMRFVEQSMKTLRPGSVAVHTTEFNLSSNDNTYESRDLSLYRRRDIEALIGRLAQAGHRVEPVNWSRGGGRLNRVVDLPPFVREPHLALELWGYDCTSIGLVIGRGA